MHHAVIIGVLEWDVALVEEALQELPVVLPFVKSLAVVNAVHFNVVWVVAVEDLGHNEAVRQIAAPDVSLAGALTISG